MTTPETPPAETSLLTRTVRRYLRPVFGDPDPPVTNEEFPVTDIFELLANHRRQLVLEELATTARTPLSTATLAERVACAEYDCSRDELAVDQRKRVYIALTQSHLPKLTDTPLKVVSYRHEENLVDRGPEFDRIWKIYTGACQFLSSK